MMYNPLRVPTLQPAGKGAIMRFAVALTLLIAGLSLAMPVSAADSPEERAIKARQGVMRIRVFNVAPLFAMLKGDIPYDAEMASTLAGNLKIMLNMEMGRAWMKGTSNEAYPEKTRALPGIWAPDSEFAERGRAYAEAVKQLAEVAGDGLDALAPAAKDLARACKSCHEDYREEE